MGAPRACGDDPNDATLYAEDALVLPAHAGMILKEYIINDKLYKCSPRMRG